MAHTSNSRMRQKYSIYLYNNFVFDVIDSQIVAGKISTSTGDLITIFWGDGSSDTGGGSEIGYSHDYGYVGSRRVHIVNKQCITKFTMTRAGTNIKFDLSRLPAGLTYFACSGSNTITGNLSRLPAGLTYFACSGSNTINGYSGKTWANNMRLLYNIAVYPGGLSTNEIDQLLIDLSIVPTWVQEKIILLTGTHSPRSSASDTAVSTLAAKGVSVTTN